MLLLLLLMMLMLEAFVQTRGTRLAHQACLIDACIGIALDRKSLSAARELSLNLFLPLS